MRRLRPVFVVSLLGGVMLAAALPTAAQQPPEADTPPEGSRLLTDPYLQLPGEDSVHVAWVTEFPGRLHLVLHGEGVEEMSDGELGDLAELGATSTDAALKAADDEPGVQAVVAQTTQLSQTREDADSAVPGETYEEVTERELWRHEALVEGLAPGERVPYRVVSMTADWEAVVSDVFTLAPLPEPGVPQQILLTSDHQLKRMTPANLQKVEETVGRVDAVFFAGDLVNVPDRASEWFDDAGGFAFFPSLQGNASTEIETADGGTVTYGGGELLQHAPLYSALGNHEVMGRVDAGDLGEQYNAPLPREIAEATYEARADEVNPEGDPEVRERWLSEHTFNSTTYQELFTLPTSEPGGETYYATTFDDVRLVSLYATRIWRTPNANADRTGAFREASEDYDDPDEQGYGRFIFEPISEGSEQYEWLRAELASEEFQAAEHTVVMLHHPIHTLGDNVVPPFTDPVRYVERGPDGEISFIRYEYPKDENHLIRDVQPLLEEAGVDLVLNGHSHVWNRFEGPAGVDYLETSNVGNSYGGYVEGGERERTVPGAPWNPANYDAVGDPYGLEPVGPNDNPMTTEDGTPLPFLASNEVTAFSDPRHRDRDRHQLRLRHDPAEIRRLHPRPVLDRRLSGLSSRGRAARRRRAARRARRTPARVRGRRCRARAAPTRRRAAGG